MHLPQSPPQPGHRKTPQPVTARTRPQRQGTQLPCPTAEPRSGSWFLSGKRAVRDHL